MTAIYDNKTIKNMHTIKIINQNIERHSHFFWEFSYCINGRIIHNINGHSVEAHAFSEIVLLKPKDIHQITNIPDASNPSHTFHRDIYVMPEKMKRCCDFLSPTLYNELLSKDVIVLDGKYEHLENLEHSLNLFAQHNAYLKDDLALLEKLHTTIIFQLLSIYFKDSLPKTTYPAWITSFFTKLKSETFLCKSIEDITKEFNYSHAYLCRTFKKYTGKTMVQCLNESRVIYSTILLLDPKNSILEIAMRLNYSSQSAYCNAFKEVYHVSPKEWQKLQFES